jgi:hypothetical protein
MMKKMMKKLAVLTAIMAVALGACSNPSGGSPFPEPPDFDLWDGITAADSFAGGNGSFETPYIIRTGAQLAYLAKQVNAGTDDYEDEYFTLARNLDLNRREWTAIGTWPDHRFKGNFDGEDHVISGLRINKPSTDFQGLFGVLDGAEIRNLGLKDVAIQGRVFVGGIAGAVNSSSIENSYSTGAVSGDRYAGGIAGHVQDSSIKNCAALNPSVTATSNYAGRITGYIYISNTFTGNKAWADMSKGGGVDFTTNTYNHRTDISTARVKDGLELPSGFKTSPWTYTPGKLPILDGLAGAGQDDTLPRHFTD